MTVQPRRTRYACLPWSVGGRGGCSTSRGRDGLLEISNSALPRSSNSERRVSGSLGSSMLDVDAMMIEYHIEVIYVLNKM